MISFQHDYSDKQLMLYRDLHVLCVCDCAGEGGEVQQQLDRTGAMLEELRSAQYERHSQPPPPHLSLLSGPSDREVELGEFYIVLHMVI